MRKLNIPVVLMLVAAFLAPGLKAQDSDFSKGTIKKNYTALVVQKKGTVDDFNKQIDAILKLFSSMFGAGFVHTASLHRVGGIDVGVRGVLATVPEEFQNVVKTPAPPEVVDPLENTGFVPFPFLHASLGLPANFEVTARVFSFSVADEPSGSITLLGGAVKYGLFQDNLALPAVTLLAGYQALLVPDEYAFGTISTASLKAYISKGFAMATIYGGGGVDFTKLKLDISGLPPDFDKNYDVTYPNGTIGITVSPLPLVKVNADFNFGEFRTFTTGVGISFR